MPLVIELDRPLAPQYCSYSGQQPPLLVQLHIVRVACDFSSHIVVPRLVARRHISYGRSFVYIVNCVGAGLYSLIG